MTRTEDPDNGYMFDRFGVTRSTYWLGRTAEEDLGFPIAIYPVLVLWGRFEAGESWIGNLAIVHGSRIVDWLASRPEGLIRPGQRDAVAAWVKKLPSA